MTWDANSRNAPEAVALQSAVLCVDCEVVTSPRGDQCPICGGHALLALAGMVGGNLVEHRSERSRSERVMLFDVELNIRITALEGAELTSTIEGITRVLTPKLERKRAAIHMNVQPIAEGRSGMLKVA